MRTLKFTQIADSRFTDNIVTEINHLKNSIASELERLPGVSFRCLDYRILKWKDGSKQRRITFHVQKSGRKTTWSDIYKAVNKVKAVPYNFINGPSIEEVKQSPFYTPV